MALSGLLAVLVFGQGIRRSFVLWILLAAVAAQILSWSLGVFSHPDWMADNPRIDRLAKLFIFIAVAWWLGGSTRNVLSLWLLAILGLLLASVIQGDGIDEWLKGFSGERVGFGIRNGQHGAMLFGVVLLGMAVFTPRWLRPGPWRAFRCLAWSVLFVLSVIAVLIGQTRAIWLALLVVLPLVCGVFLYVSNVAKYRVITYRSVFLSLLGLSVVLLGAGLFLKEPLLERATKESSVIGMLLQGKIDEVPYTSIGIRIHSWQAAFEWIEQRPFVGWGGEARGLVMDHTPWLPDHVKEKYGHLHNYFLEVWVAYGLVGLLVVGALAFWIGLATWRSWRAGVLPGDMALFGFGFFVYWIIVNQFESYNSFWTGVYVHNLVVGGLVTHYWRLQAGHNSQVPS
ncbi:O-antigen ligase family protein [Halomonas sp. DP8Y7-3]|uniref:O-antigen ligase family protein n=1 Tax=Halomonas sp. DP8Y7-3 TaxID=2859079 RepID=UPI001C95EACE|nr:O-antigen ligase family protein [Halomonas sp. DP8Y7-3]MBY5930377.1 O-antigen ligase family protein [Halomonas sp. DP8Y7-3]